MILSCVLGLPASSIARANKGAITLLTLVEDGLRRGLKAGHIIKEKLVESGEINVHGI